MHASITLDLSQNIVCAACFATVVFVNSLCAPCDCCSQPISLMERSSAGYWRQSQNWNEAVKIIFIRSQVVGKRFGTCENCLFFATLFLILFSVAVALFGFGIMCRFDRYLSGFSCRAGCIAWNGNWKTCAQIGISNIVRWQNKKKK